METMTQNIDLNNLDKSTWETFKFEDIAQKISKTVKPDEALVDIYIGLEHIDANDIHIRRKGVPADVKGGKLRCYPGDVIFGKRRAYQRKAAIVDFDGICSAHAFVFRANEEIIDSKLFPFFLHSDQFMHRMVDISVGGLSPTINWGDLKQQEFLLPPKDQQAKLAELLWAADEVVEKEKEVLQKIKVYSKTLFINHIISLKENEKIRLGDVCLPKQWKTIPKKELIGGDYIVYGGNGIIGRYTEFTHENPVIAVACRGEYCGNIHLTKPKSYVTGNSMCLDKLDESLFKVKYLYYYLYYSNLDSVITGSAQPQIIKEDISRFKLRKIDLLIQDQIIQKMDSLMGNKSVLESKISSSKALQKSLINQVF